MTCCNQLVSICVGWPNGEKLASPWVRINLRSTKVNASPRKWVARQNARWTQVEHLRWLASPFYQGFIWISECEECEVIWSRKIWWVSGKRPNFHQPKKLINRYTITGQEKGACTYPVDKLERTERTSALCRLFRKMRSRLSCPKCLVVQRRGKHKLTLVLQKKTDEWTPCYSHTAPNFLFIQI